MTYSASSIAASRSNRKIFVPRDTGSPHDSLVNHISGLGPIARLDFERCQVAGEVLYAVEGDALPTSQQDEEARIGTLAYALKRLDDRAEPAKIRQLKQEVDELKVANEPEKAAESDKARGLPRFVEDAAEFIRCLNAIYEDGDARSRQLAASYFYSEIAVRGMSEVLKEMALLAMELASLNPVADVVETGEDDVEYSESAHQALAGSRRKVEKSFFEQEVESIERMIRGRRKSACFLHDDYSDWLSDLEAGGASVEDLDRAFTHLETIEQYDEGGAVIIMSSHERTVACGCIDPEFSAEDLPGGARHLAGELRRAYADGVEIEVIWSDLNAQIEIIFPASGRTATGERFYSHANRELQRFTRQVLETILDECKQDFHLTALRTNHNYRHFHTNIRQARDTKMVGELAKRAYEAFQSGKLSLKHFTALKTVSILQRERLQSARLSKAALKLIKEINEASEATLRYLSWALYGNNQPSHPVHTLASNEIAQVWDALNARRPKKRASNGIA